MSQADPSVSKPRCQREDALTVVRELSRAGHIAYFAGGCVRDLLLGQQPKDYDVATNATPQQVRALFRNSQAVGAAFGVILVRVGGSQIEVATFRSDLAYADGRHPSAVRFTSAEEDAQRRDFTINGLFLDPLTDKVIDYVGGQADLRARSLRAIGEAGHRFEEDHLRLLRAVRFASRFQLAIEPNTALAIAEHAIQLKRISPERVADELRLILTSPSRQIGWKMLREFNLIDVIFRTLPQHEPTGSNAPFALFGHLPDERTISFSLALAVAALEFTLIPTPVDDPDIEKQLDERLRPESIRQVVQACRTTLKISNEVADGIACILEVAPLLQPSFPRVSRLKRFLARPCIGDALLFLETLKRAGHRTERITSLQSAISAFAGQDVSPLPLLTGDDLIAAGLKPGRLFKRLLDEVYDAQLEEGIHSKAEALALSFQLMKSI